MCSFFLLLFLLTDHNLAYEHSCIVAIEITFLWMLIYFLLLFFISGFLFVCLLFCFIGQALNRQSGLVSNSQPYCRNYPLPCRIAYKQINDGCDHSNISHWFSFFSSTMRPLWFLSEVTNQHRKKKPLLHICLRTFITFVFPIPPAQLSASGWFLPVIWLRYLAWLIPRKSFTMSSVQIRLTTHCKQRI